MSLRKDVIDHIGAVVNIPAFVAQIIAELQKSEVDLNAVVQLIEMDPNLTASLLRLVNSSAFAADHPITTVREASVRLGSYNLMQMVIGSSMSGVMSGDVPGYDLPAGELWKSSVTAAVFTDVIIDVLNLRAPGHTFTAALLRDVGKIVLGSFPGANVDDIIKYSVENNVSFPEAEYAILGIDHAEVGAVLLRRWHLPEALCTPVCWHHVPEEGISEKLVTYIVHLADALTCLAGSGVGNDGLMYNISSAVVDEFNLDVKVVEQIMCLGMEQVSQADGLMG